MAQSAREGSLTTTAAAEWAGCRTWAGVDGRAERSEREVEGDGCFGARGKCEGPMKRMVR